jgi:hypothetical protein
MKPICFFSFVSDKYFEPIGTLKMINSFKRFHPDIDLVVFRQDVVDYVFKKWGFVNWLNAKPTFAKLLVNDYETVINVDADTVFLSRLDEVLEKDWEICTVSNKNDYESRAIENVTEEEYVHAAFVGSRRKDFWDIWEEANRDDYMYKCAENDVLSLIWKNNPTMLDWKKRVFDLKKEYWGCKSLGREGEFTLDNGKVMCRGEQVRLYHQGKGPAAMPKLIFENMGFNKEVVAYMNYCGDFGKSQLYETLPTL